jgi:uncharacterized protein (TIGR02391 family)
MENDLREFEQIVRRVFLFSDARATKEKTLHPFDERNIYSRLPTVVKKLFDDGHYAQSTFEAFKFVDNEIQRLSGLTESGFKLMMQALPETSPLVKLTPCSTMSEKDEQKGYQFLFAGSILAIRNPRGHESISDSPDICLDHLSLASILLRRLESAGFKIKSPAAVV